MYKNLIINILYIFIFIKNNDFKYFFSFQNQRNHRYKAFGKIKQICSRHSPYTMLMRAVATDNMKPKDLTQLFD